MSGYGPPSTPEVVTNKPRRREIIAWVLVVILAILSGVSVALVTSTTGTLPPQAQKPVQPKSVAESVQQSLGISKEQWNAEYAKAQKRMDAALDRAAGVNQPPTHKIPDFSSLPKCKLEDGSTQKVCIWDGHKQGNKVGAIVINIDCGKFSYYPETDGWVRNS